MKKFLSILFFLVCLFSLLNPAYSQEITITSPQDNTFVNETVLIEAQLTKIPKIKPIKFYIDNELVGEDTASPYQYSWDTTAYSDGEHQIYASKQQTPKRSKPFKNKVHPLDSPAITVTVDNTPPQGTITINNGNSYTNLPQVTLTLSAVDNLSGVVEMQFSNDGSSFSTPESYSTSKLWILTAGDGTKTVYVKFRDGAGNWSGDTDISDTIILDTTDPVVSITSPLNGAIFTTTSISVTGAVNDNIDNNPVVAVNGETATVDSGTFTAENINLSLGQNDIIAEAIDLAGNSSSDSITVTVDNTPPTTPVVTDGGDYTTSLTELHATWSSQDLETGISEYKYSIGTAQGQIDIVNWTSAGTNTQVTHTGLSLAQGQTYYFNVIAINGAGIESDEGHSDGIIANDETTLLINITSPEDNALFNTSPITIEGTISTDSAAVTVNSVSAAVIDNTFSASVEITKGINIITAKAILGCQTATKQIDVKLDLTPPSINVFTPDENATTKSNIIYGRVSEDTTSVTINDAPAELIEIGEYNKYFIAQPSLIEGINTITIEAQDQAGNIGQKTHAFTYDTTTPKVTITNPAHNTTINLSPITVSGANTTDISYIFVETSTGTIEDTNFTADYIRLNPIKSVITATGYDELDNKYQDAIIIKTPELKHYELIKVSGDIAEYEEGIPEAGSNWDLTIKLYCNDAPIINEEIEFTITQGNGALVSQYALTDFDGLATTTLTTDTDASIINKVETKSLSHPLVKTTFSVDTKPAQPANLIKLTNESVTPVPGATIPIIVKLTDAYNNAIQDEQIDFSISQGTGTLSANSATTNYYGEASVNFTAPVTPETVTQITASLSTDPAVTTTFSITTSEPLIVTIDDIITKVNANDEKIQDIKADIYVTSDADFLPSEMQLKIWQKGDKQKVKEISPEPQVKIRPPLETSTENVEMQREIISYDSASNIYVIKTKEQGQTEEYSYEIDYVDYTKGVVIKTKYYSKTADEIDLYVIEDSDFVQIDDIWIFQKESETLYKNLTEIEYTTTNVYSNIQINTGIPDWEFE